MPKKETSKDASFQDQKHNDQSFKNEYNQEQVQSVKNASEYYSTLSR